VEKSYLAPKPGGKIRNWQPKPTGRLKNGQHPSVYPLCNLAAPKSIFQSDGTLGNFVSFYLYKMLISGKSTPVRVVSFGKTFNFHQK
jgi:hypothetical protein